MLILASRHSVQLAQLLDEFVHGKHGTCKSFTFLIYVFGTIDDFAIQNLIRVNEVCHLAAENSAGGNHATWNSSLYRLDIVKSFHEFDLFFLLDDFQEFLCVLLRQPVYQERGAFQFFASHDSLHKSAQEFCSSINGFLIFLLLLYWKSWNYDIWISFQKHLSESVEILILPVYGPAQWINLNLILQITCSENSTILELTICYTCLNSLVIQCCWLNLSCWSKKSRLWAILSFQIFKISIAQFFWCCGTLWLLSLCSLSIIHFWFHVGNYLCWISSILLLLFFLLLILIIIFWWLILILVIIRLFWRCLASSVVVIIFGNHCS